MANDIPKVSFKYNVETGSFKIEVTKTTKISYSIEYEWQNVDEDGNPIISTDALINTVQADEAKIATDEPIAGTESSDDIYVHEVKKGILDLQAVTLDGSVMTYKASFKVNEAGTLKIISEQITTKADPSVLGESTASAQLKKQEMDMLDTIPTTQQVAQPTEMTIPPVESQQTTNIMPVAIVSVLIGVTITLAMVGGYFYYQKKTALQKLL